jgi:hypothetical protein
MSWKQKQKQKETLKMLEKFKIARLDEEEVSLGFVVSGTVA